MPDTCALPLYLQGNADAAAKFQEAQKAYETLRDPEKRRIYDQVGPEGMDRMGGAGGPGGDGAGFGGMGGMGGFGGFPGVSLAGAAHRLRLAVARAA